MKFVDCHCHLQDTAFDDDREEVIRRSLEELAWLVVVGEDLETSRQAVELARENIYATVGVHPHHAEQVEGDVAESLKELLAKPRVIAVGETGLDYFYDHAPRDAQRSVFSLQLGLACEAGVPVVIHSRDAEEDIAALVEPYKDRLPGGVMHCFSGDAAFAERCVEWGFYISFAGNVTFPRAADLRETVRAVPLDRLLVETDSPHLAPQPIRGDRCEPAFVRYTAEVLAQLKSVSLEELAQKTAQNAKTAFHILDQADESGE